MAVVEFKPWPKTPRLYRQVTITEKIDGTNGAVVIQPFDPEDYKFPPHIGVPAALDGKPHIVCAQSRRRLIHSDADNHGFAAWVHQNAEYLANTLGPGYHYGEWWGVGIQRGYGMSKRIFSLFNLRKWGDVEFTNDQLRTVPVLYQGAFSDYAVDATLGNLRWEGSKAAPGFMNPEGVCVFHEDSNQVFKVLAENDHLSKSAVNTAAEPADWFTPFKVAA